MKTTLRNCDGNLSELKSIKCLIDNENDHELQPLQPPDGKLFLNNNQNKSNVSMMDLILVIHETQRQTGNKVFLYSNINWLVKEATEQKQES